MLYFIVLFVLIASVLVDPAFLFPDYMDKYGTYLMGVAAIAAVLKYVMPCMLIFLYKKTCSNELIWKIFLEVSCADDDH